MKKRQPAWRLLIQPLLLAAIGVFYLTHGFLGHTIVFHPQTAGGVPVSPWQLIGAGTVLNLMAVWLGVARFRGAHEPEAEQGGAG